MELIPGQRLLCKYSQEQPPQSVALLRLTDSSQHLITPRYGQARCTENVLVPHSHRLTAASPKVKEPSRMVWEINAALLLLSDCLRLKMVWASTPGKVEGKCWSQKLLAVYGSWLCPVLHESLSALRSEHPSSRQHARLPCRTTTPPHTSASSPLLPPLYHLLSLLCEESLRANHNMD